MKKLLLILVLISSLGCAKGTIRADMVEGTVLRVADRHDVYTNADVSLNRDERKRNLRDTELLRRLFNEIHKQEHDEGDKNQ